MSENTISILSKCALVVTLFSSFLFLFQNCSPFESLSPSSQTAPLSSTFDLKPLCNPKEPATRSPLARLTNNEYKNTILDNFNVSVSPNFPIEDSVGPSGFSNDAEALNQPSNLSFIVIQNYFVIAEATASAIVNQQLNTVKVCTQATQNCRNQILDHLALKTYRRPLTDQERQELLNLFATQSNLDEGIELTLTAMLASPNFLYRSFGQSPNATSLNSYELASRLSYLIWQSAPDQELLNLANNNSLSSNLKNQIQRMLSDPKSQRLLDSFADEWLNYSKASSAEIRTDLFDVDPNIGPEAVTETKEFLRYVLFSSPRLLDLWDADYTFLNASMAKHYDLQGVNGDRFSKVTVGNERGGLMGHASILMNTSGGSDLTHPVTRGAWMVARTLCDLIPPPPEGIPPLEVPEGATSPKEVAQQHSANPACIGCHRTMDPLGFGLENYNPVGQWRDTYSVGQWSGFDIDSTGIIEKTNFSNPGELKRLVASLPKVHRCISRQVASFALRRSPSRNDYCSIESNAKNVVASGGSFADLLYSLVISDPFASNGKDRN